MKRPASWRDFQRNLQRHERFGIARRQFTILLPLVAVLGVTFLSVWYLACRATGGSGGPIPAVQAETADDRLSKPQLASLLGNRLLDADKPELLTTAAGRKALYAQTTIDCDLQRYITKLLADSGSLRGACVVLEPETGRVLTLASHNPQSTDNLCLEASPAASLFKLITAAAAIEERGFRADSRVSYCGDPHGLPGRAAVKNIRFGCGPTLAEAFARSINPVFGGLGAVQVGSERLRRFGERCCFNRAIPFELPLAPSHLEVPDDDIEIARVASGYNRTTTITPVHAALLAAAVVEDGRIVEPSLIVRVVDGGSHTLYSPHPATLEQAFSPRCAAQLREMMEATVTEGTARRSLLPSLGRAQLSNIEVGGKTGSISGDEGKVKYDWFAGYAVGKQGEKKLALAVFQEHGDYLGHKSPTIAALAIRHYFGLEDIPMWKPQLPRARACKAVRKAPKRSVHRHRRARA